MKLDPKNLNPADVAFAFNHKVVEPNSNLTNVVNDGEIDHFSHVSASDVNRAAGNTPKAKGAAIG